MKTHTDRYWGIAIVLIVLQTLLISSLSWPPIGLFGGSHPMDAISSPQTHSLDMTTMYLDGAYISSSGEESPLDEEAIDTLPTEAPLPDYTEITPDPTPPPDTPSAPDISPDEIPSSSANITADQDTIAPDTTIPPTEDVQENVTPADTPVAEETQTSAVEEFPENSSTIPEETTPVPVTSAEMMTPLLGSQPMLGAEGPESDPTITSVYPEYAVRDQEISYTIFGSNFVNPSVKLNASGSQDVWGDVEYSNDYQIDVRFLIPYDAPDSYTLWVHNEDGSEISWGGAITVFDPISVDVVTPDSGTLWDLVPSVLIQGSGFRNDMEVWLYTIHDDVVDRIDATDIVVTPPSGITCSFDLTSADPIADPVYWRDYSVHVGYTGGPEASLEDGFRVFQYSPPEVTGVDTNVVNSGALVPISIYGTGILNGAIPTLSRPGYPDILASQVIWVSDGELASSFDLAGAETGPWQVIVLNPDGQQSNSNIQVLVIPIAPIAEFSADLQAGPTPLTVHFTDLSECSDPTEWYWEFGDGNTSSEQNPEWTYTSPGMYSVRFRTTNASGEDWENKTDYISVSDTSTSYPVHNRNTTTDYASIQAAVDDANEGDLILVDPGMYQENVKIDLPIILQSSSGDPADTIIQAADSTDHVLEITATEVEVSGFTLTGADAYDSAPAGIYIHGGGQCIIGNIDTLNNYQGVLVQGSDGNTFSSTWSSYNNMFGYSIQQSTGNTFTDAIANENWAGFTLNDSYFNVFTNAEIQNNEFGFYLFHSDHNEIERPNAHDNTMDGIYLYVSNENTISSGTFEANAQHIEIAESVSDTVTGNDLHDGPGIFLAGGSGHHLIDNTLTGSDIRIEDTQEITLSGNTIQGCDGNYGVRLENTRSSFVTQNTIVLGSGEYTRGLDLETSDDNTINGNVILHNYAEDLVLSDSNNNLIYDNWLGDARDDSENDWNVEKTPGRNILGGSYLGGNAWGYRYDGGWSTYAGTDLDGDGLGDTAVPYHSGGIEAGGDYLPLVEENLLVNPDFEGYWTGWDQTWSVEEPSIYELDDSTAGRGVFSMKGTETSSDNLGRCYQDVTGLAIPGHQYRISGRIRTLSVTGAVVIGLDYVNASEGGWTPGDGYIQEIGGVSGTTGWTYFESLPIVLPPMPSDADALWFLFDFNNGAGTAWFDSVRLVETGAPTTPSVHNLNQMTDFSTIQAAIDDSATQAGDVIEVDPGTYTENIIVNKPLIIQSATVNPGDVVLQAANPANHILLIEADDVTIRGFTITGTTGMDADGIVLSGVSRCWIENTVLHSNYLGIKQYQTQDITITGCVIQQNTYGISITDAIGTDITSSNISANDHYGIEFGTSGSTTISDTFISGNDIGISVWDSDNDNVITGNTISNNNLGIYCTGSDGNLIFNNFFDNIQNAQDDGTNRWNQTPSAGENIINGPFIGGNYWHDYTGIDQTGDGLGDTYLPYDSSGNIQNGGDWHPLTTVGEPTSSTIGYGENIAGSLAIAGEQDMYTFTGTAGETILSRMYASWYDRALLRLYAPNESLITSCSGYYNCEFTTTLPSTGTYTLVAMDYDGGNTGEYGISLQRTSVASNAIAIGYGDTIPGTIAQLAEMHSYTFSGVSGETILSRMYASWYDRALLRLYAPDGSLVTFCSGYYNCELNTTLPFTGTYSLLAMDLDGGSTGSHGISLQRASVASNSRSIQYGDTIPGTISQLAEMQSYTFTGTAGETILSRMYASWYDRALLRLYAPDGSLVTSCSGYNNCEFNTTLPLTGSYSLLAMDLDGGNTGSYGISLQRTSVAENATIIEYGDTVPAVISVPAEIDSYTFNGTTDDPLVARMYATWYDRALLRLYAPDGSLVTSCEGYYNCEIGVTLPQDGTYSLLAMDLDGGGNGVYGISLQRTLSPGKAVPVTYGTTVPGMISSLAEIDSYSFLGSSDDTVLCRLSVIWYDRANLRLYAPDGSLLDTCTGYNSCEINETLPLSGTYTVLAMDLNGDSTGSYSLMLQSSSEPPYLYRMQWGSSGSDDGKFQDPWGLAIDTDGAIYIADMMNNRVQKFSSSGEYLAQWGEFGSGNGQLDSPHGIAVDASGNVYVADAVNQRIQKFSPDGTYLMQIAGFYVPDGIAIDGEGNIFVAESFNNRIQKYSSSGTYLTQWGSAGTGDGQFDHPRCIAVDADGNVYVGDDNSRIQKFSPDGTYLTQWGSAGSDKGQFSYPRGIAVVKNGDVFVADTWNNRIQKFTSEGVYLTQWGSPGSGNGEFNLPEGIGINDQGSVYVVDSKNYRIQMFSQTAVLFADFSASPRSGLNPLQVQFNDLSIGNPLSWNWDFGDDDTTNATEQNPIHAYNAAGLYDVSLTVTDDYGSHTKIKTEYISVQEAATSDLTMVAAGISPYYIGETIRLSGTNEAGSTTYLFLTGPNLPENGVSLANPAVAALSGNSATFAAAEVMTDKTWSYQWNTKVLRLEEGSYTIHAVAEPVNISDLGDIAHDQVSLDLENPFVSAMLSASELEPGEEIYINGTATGNPTQGVAIWIFGTNKLLLDIRPVEADGTFSLHIFPGVTADYGDGEYQIVVQHPMNNDVLDVYLDLYNSKVVSLSTGTYFYLSGPNRLPTSEAYQALLDMLAASQDDTYTKLSFTLSTPNTEPLPPPLGGVTIASLPPTVYVGETLTLSGTNTVTNTTYLFLKGPNLPFNGAKLDDPQTAAITGVPSTFTEVDVADGTWIYVLDTRLLGLDPGEYTIFAVSQPNNRNNLDTISYDNITIELDLPFLTGSLSQSVVAVGDELDLQGAVTGDPTPGVALWIFGPDHYFAYVVVPADYGVYQYSYTPLAPGEYHVLIQHPMINDLFDVFFVTDSAMDPFGNSALLLGPGSPEGLDAMIAVEDLLDNSALDDSYTKVAFLATDEAPAAVFTADTLSGPAPLTVHFTDASAGDPFAWNWSFGDGEWFNTTNYLERNATHVYQNPGVYTVSLTVTNVVDSDTATETDYISVSAVNQPPVLASIGPQSTAEGLELSFSVSASDPDKDPLTYDVLNLPAGAYFYTGDLWFDWTPDYGQAGTYFVNFTVTDGEFTDFELVQIIVSPTAPVNHPPVLDPIGPKSTEEGVELTFSLSATDPDEDELTFNAIDLPEGAEFIDQTFTWTPYYGQAGSYFVNFTVSDGDYLDYELVEILVTAANRPPVLDFIGPKSISEGQQLSFSVYGSDLDEDPLTFSADNLPEGAYFYTGDLWFDWTPDYGQAGTYFVNFTVTDGEFTDFELVQIIVSPTAPVNHPPVLDPIGPKSTEEGVELTFSLSATDPDEDELTFNAIDLPEGAEFIDQTFTWTPASEQVGTYFVNFTVSDGEYSDYELVEILVSAQNHPPVLDSIGPKSVGEGEELSFLVGGSDPDEDPLTFMADNLPNGAEFSDQTFTWTPIKGQAGTYLLNFTVSDDEFTDFELVEVTVSPAPPVNQPPVLDFIGSESITEGLELSFTVTASDPDGDFLIFDATDLPTEAEFIGQNFTWTPVPGQAGTYFVNFTVNDGEYTDYELVSIVVSPANRPPVLNPIGPKSATEGLELLLSIDASDPDEDPLTFVADNLPSGAVFIDQAFSWTPIPGQNGTYVVNISVSDGEDIDFELVEITVYPAAPANHPPVLDPIGPKSTVEGGELLFTVTGSDPEGDPLSFIAEGVPVTASFNSDTGEFTWSPGLGEAGVYTVTFLVTDGALTDMESVPITVNPVTPPVNNPPVLDPIGEKMVDAGQLLTFAVSGSDPDGDPVTFDASGLPLNATFAGQEFSWTPVEGEAGTYQVTFTVSDGSLMDSEAVTITVTLGLSINNPPVLDPIADQTTDEGGSISFTVTGYDPDNDPVTFDATGTPPGASFIGNTFSWTTQVGNAGSYPVIFTISDGSLFDSQVVTLTVLTVTPPVNNPPILNPIGDQSVDEGSLLSFEITGSDPDGDPITIAAEPLPLNASFAGGMFTWIPVSGEAGIYQITFTISDGALSDTELVTITVNGAIPPTNLPPTLDLIGDKTVDEGSALSFTVTGSDPEGNQVTLTAENLPSTAIFTSQTGDFSWTPATGEAGIYQVVFTINDGELFDSETVTIMVNPATPPVNNPPVLDPIGEKMVDAGQLLTFAVSGSDPDGDPVTFDASGLPLNATFAGQEFSWTPVEGEAGTYQVTFTVSDGSLMDSEVVNITVLGPVGGDMGYYLVQCDTEDAAVYFDQDYKGTIHDGSLLVVVYLTATPYRNFTVQHEGYQTVSGSLSPYPEAGMTRNLYITMAPLWYTLHATAGSGGQVTPSGEITVVAGGNQTFNVTPFTSYIIESVIIDGNSQGALSSYTFEGVEENHTILVTFRYAGISGGGGGGGGGSSTMSSNSALPAAEEPAPAPAPETVPAPAQQGYDFTIPGLIVTAIENNERSVTIYPSVLGDSVHVQGNTITITREAMIITIETQGLQEELSDQGPALDGVITSVMVTTTPVKATTPAGMVEVSIDVSLDTYPEGGRIDTIISPGIDSSLQARFEEIARQNNLEIQDVLFTLEVRKTNIGQTGPATLWATVPRAWVEGHGGTDSIYAFRIGDDGMTEALPASFDHAVTLDTPDFAGNTEMYVFRIASPHGLSIFGMASAKIKAAAPTENEAAAPAGSPVSPLTIVGGMVAWVMENPLLLGVAIAFIVLFVYISRRSTRQVEEGFTMPDLTGGDSPDWKNFIDTDRQKALDEIISVLNAIDEQVKNLDRVLTQRAPVFAFGADDANTIVEKFFYSCQVMEDKIKAAAAADQITTRQVEKLNNQLKDLVDRMVQTAQKSAILTQMIQEKLTAESGSR